MKTVVGIIVVVVLFLGWRLFDDLMVKTETVSGYFQRMNDLCGLAKAPDLEATDDFKSRLELAKDPANMMTDDRLLDALQMDVIFDRAFCAKEKTAIGTRATVQGRRISSEEATGRSLTNRNCFVASSFEKVR